MNRSGVCIHSLLYEREMAVEIALGPCISCSQTITYNMIIRLAQEKGFTGRCGKQSPDWVDTSQCRNALGEVMVSESKILSGGYVRHFSGKDLGMLLEPENA